LRPILAEESGVTGLLRRLKLLIRDRRGATAIEYALIAAAIFLAIVPPMTLVAANMDSTYQRILSYFDGV
jgi:Flp pilus assembly pilin Flp